VRTLPERDVAALLSVVGELAALDDALAFPPHFLERLGRLMNCSAVGYSELDRARKRSVLQCEWVEGEGLVTPPSEHDEDEVFRLLSQHPVCGYRTRTWDWTSPYKISDFATLREFRRTEIWARVYRDEEPRVNHWIDVGLRPSGAHTRVFVFTRSRGDFDERDRLVLSLLQPHLQRRYDSATLAAEAASALATLEEGGGGSDDPRHVVLCSVLGVIEFASPESRRILSDHFELDGGRVPEPLLAMLRRDPGSPVVVEHDGHRLTVRAARVRGLLVLLLAEQNVRLDRLTTRQLEIVRHVARGQTDAEVGAELGIAPATVNKHLEQIYERLGIHTRTAAAALFSALSP